MKIRYYYFYRYKAIVIIRSLGKEALTMRRHKALCVFRMVRGGNGGLASLEIS